MPRRTLWLVLLTIAGALIAGWIGLREADRNGAAASTTRSVAAASAAPERESSLFTRQVALTPSSASGSTVELSQDLPSERRGASAFAARKGVFDAAAQADDDQLDTLIAEAQASVDPIDRITRLEILLLRLAERDPAGAVRRALQGDRGDAPHLIATLATSAPEAVWRSVEQIGDPLTRVELQNAVISVWVMRDPERAFRSVAALPSDAMREQLLRQVVRGVTRQDPKLAIDLVKFSAPAERDELLVMVADQWARRDPATAAEWIESLNPRMQGQLAYRIADAFVAQQPEEALAWALRISRSPGKNLWSHMIGRIALYAPEDALRRAQAAENPAQRAQALARAVAAIAARDPALATSYLQKLPSGNARSQALNEIASQIAIAQPEAAIEWLRSFDSAEMRVVAADAIASQLSQFDVEMAARLVDRVPKDVRGRWIQQVARGYANTDLERGVEWVNRWRDEAPQLPLTFSQAIAFRSPDDAIAVIDRVADGRERDQTLTHIVGMLAMQSPESAARYLRRIDDEGSRTRAAGAVASGWARHDAEAASKWARSLESGPMRDSALSNVVPNVPQVDDMIDLIGDIQSPAERMNATFTAAIRMSHSDPQGMRTLLRRYPLDPQRQQQLESMVQQGRDRGLVTGR